MRYSMHILLKLTLAGGLLPLLAAGEQPLRLCIAGLVHGHVDGFLRSAASRKDVEIAGIFDPDTTLQRQYAKRFGLADSVFYTNLGAMLDRVKPEAVASFTSTFDHAIVVEACARRHPDRLPPLPRRQGRIGWVSTRRRRPAYSEK